MSKPLTTDLSRDDAYPYFLWDDPMTVGELREALRTASPPERARLLGRVLREAKDTDVWLFTTPDEVAREWTSLAPHLGRRRPFWEFILREWRDAGLLRA